MKYLLLNIFTLFIGCFAIDPMIFDYYQLPNIACNIQRAMLDNAPITLQRMFLPNPQPTVMVNGVEQCNKVNKPQKRALNQHRRLAGCGGKLQCPPILHNDGSIVVESCDEYPLASSYADRTNARATCVPVVEQNLQAQIVKSYYKTNNINHLDFFIVQVININNMEDDCPGFD
jgi:hypothetical protein